MRIFLNLLAAVATLYVGNMLAPEYVQIAGPRPLILAGLTFGVCLIVFNLLVWILVIFSGTVNFYLPFVVVLVAVLVVCPASLWVASTYVPGFYIEGFWTYAALSVAIGLLTSSFTVHYE